jgi:tellurite resistance protein
MSAFDKLSSQFAQDSHLEELSREESEAFRDMLVVVAMADGQMSEEELEQLEEELGRLPFSHSEVFEEDTHELRDRLEAHIGDEESMQAFAEQIASTIEDTEHRRTALEMASTIAYKDGLEGEESDFCHMLGRAFEFDSGEIESMLTGGLLDAIHDRIG